MSSVKNVSTKTKQVASSSKVLKKDEPKEKSKPSTKKSIEEKEVKKKSTANELTRNPNSRLTKSTLKSTSTTSKLKTTSSTAKPKNKASSTSRVQKTQYFPSKNLYSNALKSLELDGSSDISEKSVVKVKETKTKFDSGKREGSKPNPVKVTETVRKTTTNKIRNRSPATPTTSTQERPRTATLRKGSIVNTNIVGPGAPTKKPEEETYEDDFESYESDFEAESSSTTSALLASEGSMSTSSEDDIPDKQTNIPAKRLSSAESDERKLDSGTFELSDFKHRQILKYIEDTVKKEDAILEDSKQEKCNHHSLSDEGFEDQRSLQFINFADAKKKCDRRNASAARKKRGEELLGMIKLDAISFTIFDSPSVPYEVFIKSYGQCCAVQASVQTGEDCISEEIQTEAIGKCDKWTQFPCKFSSFDTERDGFWRSYQMELKGVGCEDNTEVVMENNENRLESFVKIAGDVIMQLLSEDAVGNINIGDNSDSEMIFSKGHKEFNTNQVKLRECSVQYIAMDPKNPRRVLTVHFNNSLTWEPSRSVLCLWDVVDLENPLVTLESFGQISCACFHFIDKYIMAGQHEGSVTVWCIEDTTNKVPAFITPIGAGHLSVVVSLQCIEVSKEVCSLDELGKIIIWALYTEDQVVLINTQVINLPELYQQFTDFTCTDCLLIDNQLYVSTNFGSILHCSVKGSYTGVKMFNPETSKDVTCLESCPFSPSYFLAGYSNGDITLHSRNLERPLLVLQDKETIQSSSVQIIQWSKTKPFLFYVKDSRNQIHIWDLTKSDLYPEYSIKFPEEISCFRLSSQINVEGKEETAYLVIGSVEGKVYMYLLSKEHGRQTIGEYKQDVAVFLNYASRL